MPYVPQGHQGHSTHDRQAKVQVLNHVQLHLSGQLYAYVQQLGLEVLNFVVLFVGLEGEG